MRSFRICARAVSRRAFLAGAGSSLVLSACGRSSAPGTLDRPNLILTNANVWTGDSRQPRAHTITVSGNRIHSLESGNSMPSDAAVETKIVDVGGRFIMPGFNDSHIHFCRLAASINDIQLLGARRIADVLDLISDRVAELEEGGWVLASAQWHETLLGEGRMPTLQELDAVAPNHPVYIPRGGHVAVVNSRALKLAGINADTPDPPSGIIVRNSNGQLTGMLLESATHAVRKLLPKLDKSTLRRNMAQQLGELNRLGITSLTNPGVSKAELEVLTGLYREVPAPVRVHWTVGGPECVDEMLREYPIKDRSDTLKYSGLGEIGVDGGIEGAYLREPYEIVPGVQQDPEYRGVLSVRAKHPDNFEQFYLDAIDGEHIVMTHVTGDGALDVALAVLGSVRKKKSFKHLRWNLHGCFLTDDAQLAEIKRLGLYITGQTQPYLLGWQIQKWWGRERADRCMPFRAFLDAGLSVGGGSDASAGVANPLESIGWMVNRTCLGGLQFDKRWAIAPEEALSLYTRGSAETQFMEDEVGILKPGMLADLTILDQNPIEVTPEAINYIKVDATIMDGRLVFDREGLLA